MKRFLLSPVVAALMLIAACQSQATNSNSNANANSATNGTGGMAALSKEDKAVAIVITGDASNPILLVPDPITLKKSKNEKLRWCVYNNLDNGVDNVTITEFTPSDPFESHSPFQTGGIGAGDSRCTGKGKAAVMGTFKYKITVNRSGNAPLIKDPQVVIDN
jgi:hypothetical protein